MPATLEEFSRSGRARRHLTGAGERDSWTAFFICRKGTVLPDGPNGINIQGYMYCQRLGYVLNDDFTHPFTRNPR